MIASWSAWMVPSTSRIRGDRLLPRLATNADWSSSAAWPLEPVGGEHLVPVVADPARASTGSGAGSPGPSGRRGSRRRTARPPASASRPAAGRPPRSREAEPTDVRPARAVARRTIRPRHRSRPNRRSVRSRAVSRCTSWSRSSASWPVPPGARRAASSRSVRSAIDRLEARRDGGEVPLVGGDQRRVGLGGRGGRGGRRRSCAADSRVELRRAAGPGSGLGR